MQKTSIVRSIAILTIFMAILTVVNSANAAAYYYYSMGGDSIYRSGTIGDNWTGYHTSTTSNPIFNRGYKVYLDVYNLYVKNIGSGCHAIVLFHLTIYTSGGSITYTYSKTWTDSLKSISYESYLIDSSEYYPAGSTSSAQIKYGVYVTVVGGYSKISMSSATLKLKLI